MEIIIHALMAMAGIAMLTYGADRFITGASSIRLPVMMIGGVIVAAGTSLPELAAGVMSAISGADGLVVGNIVGSNIANIGMVLSVGVILLASSTMVKRHDALVMLPAALGSCVLLYVVTLDGVIGVVDGVVLLACMGVFVAFMGRGVMSGGPDADGFAADKASAGSQTAGSGGGHGADDDDDDDGTVGRQELRGPAMSNRRIIISIAAGILLLWAGSALAVEGSVQIAHTLGVPEFVVGVAVIAVGTSLPELFTVIQAARRHMHGIAISSIMGSCALNVLMVAGASSVASITAQTDGILTTGIDPLEYVIMTAFVAAGGGLMFARRRRVAVPAAAACLAAYALYVVRLVA